MLEPERVANARPSIAAHRIVYPNPPPWAILARGHLPDVGHIRSDRNDLAGCGLSCVEKLEHRSPARPVAHHGHVEWWVIAAPARHPCSSTAKLSWKPSCSPEPLGNRVQQKSPAPRGVLPRGGRRAPRLGGNTGARAVTPGFRGQNPCHNQGFCPRHNAATAAQFAAWPGRVLFAAHGEYRGFSLVAGASTS